MVKLYTDDGLALYMTLDDVLTPNEVREIVNGSDYRISTTEASEAFSKLAETMKAHCDSGLPDKNIHKKRELSIDEQIEAQWGNRQHTLRSAVNRFWKEKLKRQKYI